jgi:CBS domain-containing protein
VAVAPDDPASAAKGVMLDEGIEHVPVIADGRLVGICTRTDLMKLRADQREHERPQAGFHPGQLLARDRRIRRAG